tara:strand:+ start:2989 stop:3441 length:453 start_codon:yes stop_codon:yes gene_type:complete
VNGKSAFYADGGSHTTKYRWIIGEMFFRPPGMTHLSAIRVAKIGLALLLSVALNFSIAKVDAHPVEASDVIFEKVVFAANLVDLNQAAQDQEYGENGEAAHGFGDCHIHVLGSKDAKLTCSPSSKDRLRQWADASVVPAPLQGYYRPPRG